MIGLVKTSVLCSLADTFCKCSANNSSETSWKETVIDLFLLRNRVSKRQQHGLGFRVARLLQCGGELLIDFFAGGLGHMPLHVLISIYRAGLMHQHLAEPVP